MSRNATTNKPIIFSFSSLLNFHVFMFIIVHLVELESNNGKEHILQNVQCHSHTRWQQLRPHREIQFALQPDVHVEAQLNEEPDRQTGHQLARPRHRGSPKGQLEVVRLVVAVKRKVGIHGLVGTVVQDGNAAQKSRHGCVFGEEADKYVSCLDLLV